MYLQFLDRHAPANSVDSYQMQQNETPELGLHFADHLLIQQFLDISTSSKRDIDCLIVLGFNDTSTLVGHFVFSPREREKRDRRDSRNER